MFDYDGFDFDFAVDLDIKTFGFDSDSIFISTFGGFDFDLLTF